MATIAMTKSQPGRAILRYLRSPKGTLLILLGLISAIAVPGEGGSTLFMLLGVAMLVAAVADVALAYVIRREWIFPDGALLTGLIVALVQSPDVPAYVTVATVAIAIASKYVLRTRWSNVFNPAALALVVSTIIFGAGQSWWGSFPDMTPLALVVLLAAGYFLTNRLNKLPMVLTFGAAYFGLFTIASFFGDATRVAEIFRSPDVNTALFFGFFMLDDPPTSPVKMEDQVTYGLIVALVSFAVFESIGVVYYLLAGCLVGNGWESFRRWAAQVGNRRASSGA